MVLCKSGFATGGNKHTPTMVHEVVKDLVLEGTILE